MELLGIRNNNLLWFKSYLTDWKQADDTCLLEDGCNWDEVYKSAAIDVGLSIIKSWFDLNLLSINEGKRKFMLFSLIKCGTLTCL